MNREVEWVDWNGAMRVLKTAEVGLMPWRVLAEWCGEGVIETKAATVNGGGVVLRDSEVPTGIWAACQQGGARVDPNAGTISCRSIDSKTQKETAVTIMGPAFRKDQLLAQVPHLTPDQVKAALSLGGNWLGAGAVKLEAPTAPVPTQGKGGGAKTDRAAWDAFWMAVVELAVQERLTPAHFDDQKELAATILEMMGDALKERTIKAQVSRVWHRWVEPAA